VAVEGEPGVVLVLLAHHGAGDGVDDDDLALVVLDVAHQVEAPCAVSNLASDGKVR
jgi:hypothetical protein